MVKSPEFVADPIGPPVDPDKILAARDAGASPEELRLRAYSGEFAPEEPPDLLLPDPPDNQA